jgi:hypothetical protein
MNPQLQAFVDDLRATHRDNLVSVILYGSAAAGDFVAVHSDHNVLIVLNRIGPEDLRNAHACVREWVRSGQPVPVYFTIGEIKNAADVFPIELSQMSTARKVLFGVDVLEGIRISTAALRVQTEYELRSKLIQLRRHYIPASTSVEGLRNLMASSLSSFSALFSAALTLKGITPPVSKRETIALAAKHLGVNGAPFEKIFNIRENNFTENLDEVGANALFGEYMEQIEKVIDAIDDIEKTIAAA